MRTIHKYRVAELKETDADGALVDFLMHDGAEILAVQLQDGAITLWAFVDTERPQGRETFEVYGTGWPMRRETVEGYVGTVQDVNGFVWHLFRTPVRE